MFNRRSREHDVQSDGLQEIVARRSPPRLRRDPAVIPQ